MFLVIWLGTREKVLMNHLEMKERDKSELAKNIKWHLLILFQLIVSYINIAVLMISFY